MSNEFLNKLFKKPDNLFVPGEEIEKLIVEHENKCRECKVSENYDDLEYVVNKLNDSDFDGVLDIIKKKREKNESDSAAKRKELEEIENKIIEACKKRFCGKILHGTNDNLDEYSRKDAYLFPSNFSIDNNEYLCMYFYLCNPGFPMNTSIQQKMCIRVLDSNHEFVDFEEIDEKAFDKVIEDKISNYRMAIARAKNKSRGACND